MTLYTKSGGEPRPLPYSDTDESGDTWTDLEHNFDGRRACGWAVAPPVPTYDPTVASLAWENGAWTVTRLTAQQLSGLLEQQRSARLADLAALRWSNQQSLVWSGRVVPGDDTTLTRVTAAFLRAQVMGDDGEAVSWKFGEGDFASLTVSQLTAYGIAIGAHMQACFNRESTLAAEIAAAPDRAALIAIDITIGWPQ